MIEIEPLGPIEESTIATFEREFGLALPQEYRDWLLTFGGGETTQNYLVENGVLEVFLTLGRDDVGGDMATTRRSRNSFDAWVPKEFLVIADASGGSVSVKLGEPDSGSIWWADFDQAVDDLGSPGQDPNSDEPQPQIMHRLTDNLAEFLATYPKTSEGTLGD